MRLYLAGQSALDVVRYLRSTGDGRIEGKPVRRARISDAIGTVFQVKSLDETATRILSHVEGPIQAFVPQREMVTKTKVLETHVWNGSIPAGTFIDIGHGICLSSPRSIIVQLATKLDLVELLPIAMELCGHYSKWALPPAEPNADTSTYEENRGVTFELMCATSSGHLRTYLDHASGMRGVVGARALFKHLADHSASPMETAVYLQLCLPRRLGGYGLPHAVLNSKLTVATSSGKEVRYPDLYWEARGIDVEYNSDYAHGGDWKRYRDSRREVELVTANVTVLPLTRLQVMKVEDFDVFAQGLRRLLGVRSRALASDWNVKRAHLRGLYLPTQS